MTFHNVFYPEDICAHIEQMALQGKITEGFINPAATGAFFATEAHSPLARVRVRQGGQEGPTRDELIEQAKLDIPMVVVVVGGMGGEVASYAWGDFRLDEPLLERPFLYGIYDCYEALRSWVWQNEGRKLKPIIRDALWWQVPLARNEDLYVNSFEGLGYSEFSPYEVEPQVGDGLLFQLDGSPVINHAAVFTGDGMVYHHLFDRKSEEVKLRLLSRAFKVRKWIRRTELLYPTEGGSNG